MISDLVPQLRRALVRELPDYGAFLGADGKAIRSHSSGRTLKGKRRTSDPDADCGAHAHRGVGRRTGKPWERITSWFGCKLHPIADTQHELPVAFSLEKASAAEQPTLLRDLKALLRDEPALARRRRGFSADRGCDQEELKRMLREDHAIRPPVDIRMLWREDWEALPRKEGEPRRRPLDPDRVDNVLHTEQGHVSCRCPATGTMRDMALRGFDARRNALKHPCPAAAHGLTCEGRAQCCANAGSDPRKLGPSRRIPLNQANRRILPPTPHGAGGWRRGCARRNALERINARLDDGHRFEVHTIRGKAKMTARVGLAPGVMMALALGSVKADDRRRMRSLVRAPPKAAAWSQPRKPSSEARFGPPLGRTTGQPPKSPPALPKTGQLHPGKPSRSAFHGPLPPPRPKTAAQTARQTSEKTCSAILSLVIYSAFHLRLCWSHRMIKTPKIDVVGGDPAALSAQVDALQASTRATCNLVVDLAERLGVVPSCFDLCRMLTERRAAGVVGDAATSVRRGALMQAHAACGKHKDHVRRLAARILRDLRQEAVAAAWLAQLPDGLEPPDSPKACAAWMDAPPKSLAPNKRVRAAVLRRPKKRIKPVRPARERLRTRKGHGSGSKRPALFLPLGVRRVDARTVRPPGLGARALKPTEIPRAAQIVERTPHPQGPNGGPPCPAAKRRFALHIQVEVPDAAPRPLESGPWCGVDLGIVNTAALSDGRLLHLTADGCRMDRIVASQQRQATRTKGSCAWLKEKTLQRRSWGRMVGRRLNEVRHLACQLTDEFALLAIGDPKLGAMLRSAQGGVSDPGRGVKAKRKLNRRLARAGLGGLRRALAARCAGTGGTARAKRLFVVSHAVVKRTRIVMRPRSFWAGRSWSCCTKPCRRAAGTVVRRFRSLTGCARRQGISAAATGWRT